MTELEKVHKQLIDDIDFNKLAKEMSKEMDKYTFNMLVNSKKGKLPPPDEAFVPVINTAQAVNAFLNRVGLNKMWLFMIVAGLELLTSSLEAQLSEEEKELKKTTLKVILPSTTTVDVSAIQKMMEDKSDG